MLRITKIFHFEMAHAIHGYDGACKNIHGHSYELHVTVSSDDDKDYISAPGFVIDFKEIKKLVKTSIIEKLDHKLVLSEGFVAKNSLFNNEENIIIWKVEPSAENILIYIRNILFEKISGSTKLVQLKLYETKDSFAEWTS